MRGIRNIIILVITSFMTMGLVGCSEKVLTKEDVKTKLEYDSKIIDMLTKSAEGFPNDSEEIFDDAIKELREEVDSLFKKSKESSNLKLRDEFKKELKALETAYKGILENSNDIQAYVTFFDVETVTDKERLAIKAIFENSKKDIEKVLMEYIEMVEKGGKGPSVLNGLTMVCEREMNAYKNLTSFYSLSVDKDYKQLYEEKIPVFKETLNQRFTLDNTEVNFIDVKTQSERESVWEKAKAEVESEVKSGKLAFPTSATSNDIVIKKSGSIYVIKSYVDVTSNGTTERKEFTVKLDITSEYCMFISLTI